MLRCPIRTGYRFLFRFDNNSIVLLFFYELLVFRRLSFGVNTKARARRQYEERRKIDGVERRSSPKRFHGAKQERVAGGSAHF